MRLVAGVLGFMIACTGETHLIASILILILVALGTPSSRLRRRRWVDASVPATIIVATIVLHRWAWSALVGHGPLTPRYVFALPTLEEINLRTATYLTSLPKGITTQVQAIVEFAGPWALVSAAGAGAIGLGLWRLWPDREDTTPAPRVLAAALLAARSTPWRRPSWPTILAAATRRSATTSPAPRSSSSPAATSSPASALDAGVSFHV